MDSNSDRTPLNSVTPHGYSSSYGYGPYTSCYKSFSLYKVNKDDFMSPNNYSLNYYNVCAPACCIKQQDIISKK